MKHADKLIVKNKGFTVIELLVVIVIIGILSAVIIVSLTVSRAKSRDNQRIVHIQELQKALELYFSDNNSYPTSLDALVPNYISSLPQDPLGTVNDSGEAGLLCRANNKYCYAFFPPGLTGTKTNYHLGANLELDNIILDSDIDCNSGVNCPREGGAGGYAYPFNGSDSPNEIYDVLSQQ